MPRRPKNFTPKDLAEIEMLAGLGMNQKQIAAIKGVHVDTLRKWANKQLVVGKAMAVAQIAKTAFELAASGKCPAMTMFFLKTQGRWNEHHLPEEIRHALNAEEE